MSYWSNNNHNLYNNISYNEQTSNYKANPHYERPNNNFIINDYTLHKNNQANNYDKNYLNNYNKTYKINSFSNIDNNFIFD